MNRSEPAARDVAVREQSLEVPARDGFALGATLYAPSGECNAEDVVVFNTGGGLAAQRYRHFLRHLAAEGLPVLAYDYRGVGASRPARLRGFVAGLEDWADLDQAGVIDFARERFPGARLASVSHSIGCLVACAAPNAGELHQMVFIGPHTGYWKDYRAPWRWPMAATWHAAMPLLARVFGYFPGSRLKLGDDLPQRFALQWAGRRTPEFHLDADANAAARQQRMLDAARALTVPGLAVTFFDDAFVGENGVRRFLFAIPSAPVVRAEIEPTATGGERIGHFGFFRRRFAGLWDIVTRFLHTHVAG